jgi:hypothetical protein
MQRCQGQKGTNVWLHLKQLILLFSEGNRGVLVLFLKGKCAKSKNPRRHGPCHKVSYVYRGRSTSRLVSSDQVKEIQAELANDKRFRKLTDEWVGLALKLAKEKRKLAA